MTCERTEKLRIVLAEDHRTVRKLIQISLRQDGRFEVVAETGDGLEAVRLVKTMQPEVLVMDIRLPGMDGIKAAQKVRESTSTTKVVIISMHDDEAHIYDALAAGARGYVVKSAITDLAEAIIRVCRGEIYLTPPVTLDRIEQYRQNCSKPPLDFVSSH
jgi:two-component system response regulator DegU